MPMAADVNHVKQHHHVEKPSNPRKTAVVKTCQRNKQNIMNKNTNVIVFVSAQEKGAKEQWDKLFMWKDTCQHKGKCLAPE